MLSSFTSYIIKENLNSDGQQSQSYQENKQTPLTSILWTQNGKMYAFIQQTKYPEPLAGNVTSPKRPIKMTFIERQCTVFILPLLNLPPTPVVIKFQSQYIVFAKIMKFILSCLSPKYSLVQNVVVKRGYFEYKKTNLTWV